MGAAARFDGDDAGGGERVVAVQELGVLAGEDVVGHGGEGVGVAQGGEEGEEEGGFAGSDGAVFLGGGMWSVEVAIWGGESGDVLKRGGERRRKGIVAGDRLTTV